MKVSLVVAQGAHAGKSIPIPTPQFLIGREASCQLRPASEIVSKRHCAILVRDGRVFIRDFGSTNGTFLNDQKVVEEQEITAGDNLKVGPLEFTLKIEGDPVLAPKAAPTLPKTVLLKIPTPASPPAQSDTPTKEEAALNTPLPTDEEDSDRIAAMMLEMGGDDAVAGVVPDGTTVLDMPALSDPNQPAGKKAAPKPAFATTSSAAEAILKKYRQRPRT